MAAMQVAVAPNSWQATDWQAVRQLLTLTLSIQR